MKKIYITDLDHTFLKSDLSISAYTRNVWNSFATHSIMSVATARTYKKSMEFLGGIKINAPMILLDGALIVTQDKKIIDTKFIDKDIANNIIDEGSKLGIYPFILALKDKKLNEAFLYPDICNIYQKELLKRYSNDNHLKECKNIRAMNENFKIVYMGEETLLIALKNQLKTIFGDNLIYILAPEAYLGCYFLTILHKEANKENGIKSVSEVMGFDLSNLSVFGDNFNDTGMFRLAQTSIAVNNAQDGVKEIADIVLELTNDEDAVAHYLDNLSDVQR